MLTEFTRAAPGAVDQAEKHFDDEHTWRDKADGPGVLAAMIDLPDWRDHDRAPDGQPVGDHLGLPRRSHRKTLD